MTRREHPIRWAVRWRYAKGDPENRSDAYQWNLAKPHLFCTRRACREFIRDRYGYIAHRKDLRGFPCRWRMPEAVKVRVILEEIR